MSSVIVIVLIVLITGGRLALRWKRRDLRWGPDDWAIIPAAVSELCGRRHDGFVWLIKSLV